VWAQTVEGQSERQREIDASMDEYVREYGVTPTEERLEAFIAERRARDEGRVA
jgi:hypothetical protein